MKGANNAGNGIGTAKGAAERAEIGHGSAAVAEGMSHGVTGEIGISHYDRAVGGHGIGTAKAAAERAEIVMLSPLQRKA